MQTITKRLLNWYRKNRVLYPWRTTNDPYRIWLSEILLLQTRIPVAMRFYEKILKKFPTLQQLAQADDQEFLSAWSGIGYYQRARNMLSCARTLTLKYDGRFPFDLPSLLALPGIGAYTAGAIRNLCFGKLTPASDGNIRRVLARIENIRSPVNSKRFLAALETAFLECGKSAPPAEFFQSLMELGERICLPVPDCVICPVKGYCKAFRAKTAARLPRGKTKKASENFHWYLLLLQQNGTLYFTQNRERAFLKDAWIFPDLLSTHGLTETEILGEYRSKWKIDLLKMTQEQSVPHTVTYRKIRVHILRAIQYSFSASTGKWLSPEELKSHPTSSVTEKVIKLNGRAE